jgi:hypothetical protein
VRAEKIFFKLSDSSRTTIPQSTLFACMSEPLLVKQAETQGKYSWCEGRACPKGPNAIKLYSRESDSEVNSPIWSTLTKPTTLASKLGISVPCHSSSSSTSAISSFNHSTTHRAHESQGAAHKSKDSLRHLSRWSTPQQTSHSYRLVNEPCSWFVRNPQDWLGAVLRTTVAKLCVLKQPVAACICPSICMTNQQRRLPAHALNPKDPNSVSRDLSNVKDIVTRPRPSALLAFHPSPPLSTTPTSTTVDP